MSSGAHPTLEFFGRPEGREGLRPGAVREMAVATDLCLTRADR
jgi:hypothetical protein